jgi:lysozyme family protein
MADLVSSLVTIFKHEGGFQKIPGDPGNWTGGKVGVGVLKGTKFGISAKSYPELDIENLTIYDAAQIYQRDFWNPLRLREVKNQVLATEVLDTAVNCGVDTAAMILQRAINLTNFPAVDIVEDGRIGAVTVAAVNHHRRPAALYKMLNVLQGMRYVKIIEARPQSEEFVNSWMARICEADFR